MRLWCCQVWSAEAELSLQELRSRCPKPGVILIWLTLIVADEALHSLDHLLQLRRKMRLASIWSFFASDRFQKTIQSLQRTFRGLIGCSKIIQKCWTVVACSAVGHASYHHKVVGLNPAGWCAFSLSFSQLWLLSQFPYGGATLHFFLGRNWCLSLQLRAKLAQRGRTFLLI